MSLPRLCSFALAGVVLAACAGGRGGPDGPPPGRGDPRSDAAVERAAPLPPIPWRDAGAPTPQSGQFYLTDVGRDRVIAGRWSAPPAAAVQGLVLVLPALAQGDTLPATLTPLLNAAGFALLAIGHQDNDASVWQSHDARNADFGMAARQQYSAQRVQQRAADVRFVLDELQRRPPAWLPPAALQRIGVIGIGLGAQTAQSLLGEQMTRSAAPSAEARIRTAALLGPYVGFDGPPMAQRYGGLRAPLLIAYGASESEPYGLGMTAQQRRAMVEALPAPRVLELRLATDSLPGLLGGITGPPGQGTEPDRERRMGSPGDGGPGGRSGPGGPGRGGPGGGGSPGGGPPAMTGGGDAPARMPDAAQRPSPAASRNEQASRIALLFTTTAWFEIELLGSTDAREWLQSAHPGPVTWTFYSNGRPLPDRSTSR